MGGFFYNNSDWVEVYQNLRKAQKWCGGEGDGQDSRNGVGPGDDV